MSLIKTTLYDDTIYTAYYDDYYINYGFYSVGYGSKKSMEAKMKSYAPLKEWKRVIKPLTPHNINAIYIGIGSIIGILLSVVIYTYFN